MTTLVERMVKTKLNYGIQMNRPVVPHHRRTGAIVDEQISDDSYSSRMTERLRSSQLCELKITNGKPDAKGLKVNKLSPWPRELRGTILANLISGITDRVPSALLQQMFKLSEQFIQLQISRQCPSPFRWLLS